jgi:hypothetical protein
VGRLAVSLSPGATLNALAGGTGARSVPTGLVIIAVIMLAGGRQEAR